MRIPRGNAPSTNGRRRVTAVNCRARREGGSSSFLPGPRVLQEGSRDLIKAGRRVERRVATSCKLEPTRCPPAPPSPPPFLPPSSVLRRLLSSSLKRAKSTSPSLRHSRGSLTKTRENAAHVWSVDLVRPSVCVKVRQATRISSPRNSPPKRPMSYCDFRRPRLTRDGDFSANLRRLIRRQRGTILGRAVDECPTEYHDVDTRIYR